MSGSQNDEPDFLDDDFVIDDVTGKNDDLDQLFEGPEVAPPPPKPPSDPNADEDDVLFTDHTEGLQPTEQFAGKGAFAEDAPSTWQGEQLDLESVGVPPAEAEPVVAEELAAAEAKFAEELGAMLDRRGLEQNREAKLDDADFAVDGADEIELVDPAADGVTEIEQSGPFVIDDGEGAWQQEEAAASPEEPEAVAVGADAEADAEVDAAADVETGVEAEGEDLAASAGEADVEQADEPALVGAGEGDEQTESEQAESEQTESLPMLSSVDGSEEPVAEGWEPLPARHVDQLAEVGELARTDTEVDADGAVEQGGEVESAEPALVGVAASDPADAEGHDIYAAAAAAPVLVGPRRSGRSRSVWMGLAASLMLCGGAAAVVLRPEWFGFDLRPERLEQVQIERPVVRLELTTPPAPKLAAVDNPGGAGANPVAGGEPGRGSTPGTGTGPAGGTEPKTGSGDGANPGPDTTPATGVNPATGTNPVAGTNPPTPTPPTNPDGSANPDTTPGTNPNPQTGTTPGTGSPGTGTAGTGTTPSTTGPVALPTKDPGLGEGPQPNEPQPTTLPPVAVGSDPRPETAWPLGKPQPLGPREQANGKPLVRVADDLMVGDLAEMMRPKVVDGVLPGSRAFAQLHNGNYFVGSVKAAGPDTVTLTLDKGEVTLAVRELSRLTELGSADYEELQKVTSGFIRLTNNNRLVGGILSRIADDHIVLEFRSNRVMLPKSAIGQVVQGDGDAGVRLSVTSEENDWVRKLAERQLGTGAAPIEGEVAPKSPAPAGEVQPVPVVPGKGTSSAAGTGR